MRATYSEGYTKSNLFYLDKYLGKKVIRDQAELFKVVSKVKKGKRHLCLGIRAFFNFLETFDLIDEQSLAKYRKVVKIPKTNPDNFVPEDEKVISAFRNVGDERYRILFKLLTFSGIRLKEAVYLLNNYEAKQVIAHNAIAKYPLSLERGTKRVFYAYLPKQFLNEVKKLDLKERNAQEYIVNRLPSKYIRKWHFNFLILNNVPESVADFIQGRASSTVGSMHYLAKVKQADEWYSRIADKLLELL